MLDVVEDVKNEFKVKLTDKLEICVIAFLNTNGGDLYLGGLMIKAKLLV